MKRLSVLLGALFSFQAGAGDSLLMYVNPTESYVLLHCADADDCEATLTCYDRIGESLELDPVTIGSKLNHQVSMQKALLAAGMPEADAERLITCEVRSGQDIHVRAYTRMGDAIVPVHGPLATLASAPPPDEPPPETPDELPESGNISVRAQPCPRSDALCEHSYLAHLSWVTNWSYGPSKFRLYRSTSNDFRTAAQIWRGSNIGPRRSDGSAIVIYKDYAVRNGWAYFYWVHSEHYGAVRLHAGPVGIRIPAN